MLFSSSDVTRTFGVAVMSLASVMFLMDQEVIATRTLFLEMIPSS